MYTSKSLFLTIALAAAMLQGCGGGGGGGGSDSTPPPVVKAGDFELVAGTLDAAAPADAPRYQNGPAIGVNLAPLNPTAMAVGANGHIYLLKLLDRYITEPPERAPMTQMDLIEIDPSTGLMRVQQIPYNPMPEQLRSPPYNYVEPSLTKVFDPSGFTVASDGSVLIGDGAMYRGGFPAGGLPDHGQPGYGFGIWRFKDGILSKLAGFDAPSDKRESNARGQDGQGGAATFASLDKLCAGPNGAIYVNDNFAARRVLPDGTVETLGDIVSFPHVMAYATLICATKQRAFARMVRDGKTVFGEPASGQIFGPGDDAAQQDLKYGFWDGFAINQWINYDTLDTLFAITDLKTGEVMAPWIKNPNIPSTYPPAPAPAFQLDTAPYVVPSPQIVIDNNDTIYLYSGNALLRYRLRTSTTSTAAMRCCGTH